MAQSRLRKGGPGEAGKSPAGTTKSSGRKRNDTLRSVHGNLRHEVSRRPLGAAVLLHRRRRPSRPGSRPSPVEFVVPAGTGGGADQMARLIQGIVTKHKLMKQPMIVVNKSGGAGARRLPRRQGRQGQSAQDRHHAVEPVHHAARHRRAVQLEGPDAGRRCWRSTSSCCGSTPTRPTRPRRSTRRRQGRGPAQMKMGGTGSKQEDQIITVAHREGDRHQVHLRPVQGRRRGRGAARRQARRLDRQQPDRGGRAVARRRSCGRCACSTSKRMPYKDKVTGDMSWSDIPTCKDRRALDSTT